MSKPKVTEVVTETPEQFEALLDFLDNGGYDHCTHNYKPDEAEAPAGANGQLKPASQAHRAKAQTLREALEARMLKSTRGADDPTTEDLFDIARKIGQSGKNVHARLASMGAKGRPVTVHGHKTKRWSLPL